MAKVCSQCSRLLSLNVVECPCGSKKFIEIILDFVEKNDDNREVQ